MPSASGSTPSSTFFPYNMGKAVAPKVHLVGDIHVSSTSDALLSASHLALVIEDTLLVKDASLVLQRGHCYGFIGENGAGKTTLMRALHDEILKQSDGTLEVAYVGQNDAEALSESTVSLLDHCVSGDRRISSLKSEMSQLESPDCDVPDEEAAVRIGEIMDELEALDVDNAPERAKVVLKKLGFRTSQLELPLSDLSGGWRNRLELARSLVGQPDVLLIDEPTNHLDLHAVLLLGSLLRDMTEEGVTSVVVSHDAAFLDLICTDMVSLHCQLIQAMTGNYANFEEKADQYRVYHERLYDRRQREETRQKSSLVQQKSTAAKKGNDKALKQAASRQRKGDARIGTYREDGKKFKLNSLKKMDLSYVRLPARAQPVKVNSELSLNLPQAPPSKYSNGLPLIGVDNACVGYSSAPKLLQDLNLDVSPGDRVALVGRNGAGKSTLMKFLAGDESVTVHAGSVNRRGTVALVDQNQLALLGKYAGENAVAFLMSRHPEDFKKAEDARQYLGGFGLGGNELALLPIENLSGGLRVRLVLADVFAGTPPDVLLLDEPTNHLDAETITALGNALRTYSGAVVAVSHNCAFLLNVCRDLWICEPVDKTKKYTPPCAVTMHRQAADGDFVNNFRTFAEKIVAKKDRGAIKDMLTVRAMRQAVVIQQANASTSLIV